MELVTTTITTFLLRGLPKVILEVGWLSLAHNFLIEAAIDQSQKWRCRVTP
jgi:hypothetical protein